MSEQFTTTAARRAFDALCEAAEGHDNLALYEACATLLSQVAASGSFDCETACKRVRELGECMALDIASNWEKVISQRKRQRQ